MTQGRRSAMTHDRERGRRRAPRGMMRAAAALALAGVLGTSLLACGRYGPPQPHPPAVEPEDEERQP